MNLLAEQSDGAGWVKQRPATGHFAQIDRRDERVRMSGLIMAFDPAMTAILDDGANLIEIPTQQIQPCAGDREPAAAVDPGPPAADCRHTGGRTGSIIECGNDRPEGNDIQRV